MDPPSYASGSFKGSEDQRDTDREEPNIYSVIRINPQKHDVNAAGAVAFAEFITSQAGQCLIDQFGVEEYGEPLFEAFFDCPIESSG